MMNALSGQFDELSVGGVQALKSQPLLEQVVPRTFDLALECWLVIHCDLAARMVVATNGLFNISGAI
jgi:hypothetical protein